MKLINFGSLNIDHVYSVDEFVQPGQTIHAKNYQQFCGGKGLNQSIAVARAGMQVMHIGQVGPGGEALIQLLNESGVDTSQIDTVDEATGHAIIQVAASGENEIIVFGGANQILSRGKIDNALSLAEKGDWVLCQNETSHVDYLLEAAYKIGLRTVFNPAPMNASVKQYPLDKVNLLIVNETEGAALAGQSDPGNILSSLLTRYPDINVVLTQGAKGAAFGSQKITVDVAAEKVEVMDTTAAGDTFIGYFLAEISQRQAVETCLKTACLAAGLCVQKAGAAQSIPLREELPPPT